MVNYKLWVMKYYEGLGLGYLELYLADSVRGYLSFLESRSPRGLRIIDVGCGLGVGAGLISGAAERYICLDIACSLLKYPSRLPNVDVVCADAEHIPIRPGSVDEALLINVINADGDGEGILREVSRLGVGIFARSPRPIDNELIGSFLRLKNIKQGP